MSTLKISTWLDSGANNQSCYTDFFEVDKEEWEAMTEEEKDEYAKEYSWVAMDWGWVVV